MFVITIMISDNIIIINTRTLSKQQQQQAATEELFLAHRAPWLNNRIVIARQTRKLHQISTMCWLLGVGWLALHLLVHWVRFATHLQTLSHSGAQFLKFNWLTTGCTPTTRHLKIGLIESSTPGPLHPLSSLPEVRVVSVNPASVRLLQGLAPIISKMKWQPFRFCAKHLDSFSLLLSLSLSLSHTHTHTITTITITPTHTQPQLQPHTPIIITPTPTHQHTNTHTYTLRHTIPIDQEQLLGLGIASPMHVWLPFTPWKYA